VTAAKHRSPDFHQRPHSPLKNPRDDEGAVYLLPFLSVLIVFGIGAYVSAYWTWGFNWLALLRPPWPVVVIVIAGLLIIPSISRQFWALVREVHSTATAVNSRQKRILAVSLVSIALFCLFYLLRSRAFVYGDGYLLLGSIAPGGELLLKDQNSLQAFSLIVIRAFVALLDRLWSIRAAESLAIFNSLGGVAGFWAAYRIAGTLTKDWDRKLFLIAAAFSSGSVVLFFGYVENYTWVTSLGLWTFYFSLQVLDGRKKPWMLLILAVLSLAYHAITLPFVLVAIAAVSMRRSRTHKVFGFLTFSQTMWVFTIGAGLVVLVSQATNLFQTFGLPHPFVPIWPEAANNYLAFSVAHLIDIVNLALLIAPLGLMLILFNLVSGRIQATNGDRKQQLLGLIALLTSLASFWIDPELGAPRDWDLLSFPGIPLSLWAAYRFTSANAFGSRVPTMILPAFLIIVLSIGPNIYEKNHPEIAVERLDRQLWQAPQYQTDYDEANRGLSWGTMLVDQLKRDDLAAKYFHRRLSVVPSSASAWFNLGQVYSTRSREDSAAISFENAVKYDPDNPRYLLKLVGARQKQGRFAEALPLITKCEEIDPANPTVQTNFGIVLYRLGREREAVAHFQRAYNLSHGAIEESSNLGSAYFGLGLNDSACIYLTRAVEIGSKAPRVYESLIQAQLAMGKTEEASATLYRYRAINPQAQDIDYYRNQLTAPIQK